MEVLRTAILDKLQRKNGDTFSTSEIVRQMYPEDWELFLEEINKVAIEMDKECLLTIVPTIEFSHQDSSQKRALQIAAVTKTK